MQEVLAEVNGVVSCGSSWGVWCEVRMRSARCEDAAEVGLGKFPVGKRSGFEWVEMLGVQLLTYM